MKPKRIVLVTWMGQGNYGSSLQSYALNQYLKLLGYDVSFLQHLPRKYGVQTFIKGMLSLLGFRRIMTFLKRGTIQRKKLNRFQKAHYKEIKVYSKHQESALLKRTDCFVTGSDQIWNTYFEFKPVFFLSFAGPVKRIAYASSIGTSGIKEEYKELVKKYLLDFAHIGVREKEAVRVISELTGRNDICQVLDPTFLLTPSDWGTLAEETQIEISIPDKYIFCYLIGESETYSEQLRVVKSKLQSIDNLVIVTSAENTSFNSEGAIVYRLGGPAEFVYLLRNASFVCTDSFHATALSINHSIPFVEFIRFQDNSVESQNSRIYDLLDRYELRNRIYDSKSLEWSQGIDYSSIQELLSKDRKASNDYLVNAIEK